METVDPMITMVDDSAPSKPKTKWQIVHAYKTINEATKILTFPTGDLKLKQCRMAGHRMGSVVNLASGYYTIPMDDHAVPFTAFHILVC